MKDSPSLFWPVATGQPTHAFSPPCFPLSTAQQQALLHSLAVPLVLPSLGSPQFLTGLAKTAASLPLPCASFLGQPNQAAGAAHHSPM